MKIKDIICESNDNIEQEILKYFSEEESEEFEDIDHIIEQLDMDDIIDEIVDNLSSDHLRLVLDNASLSYDSNKLPNGKRLTSIESHGLIYDGSYYSDREDWLYSLSFDDLVDMYQYDSKEWSDNFWNNINDTYIVYHATTEENWESIKEQGIEARSDSRGISNRLTDSAVFVTTSWDEALQSPYGNYIIEIDLFKMKKMGYTPMVSEEQPWIENELLRSVGHLLDVEVDSGNLASDGISYDTLAIFGNIPVEVIQLSEYTL